MALPLIVALALALRLTDLTGPSLSSDEVFSLLLVGRGFAAMVWSTALDLQHTPLYFAALWAWLQLFGDGEHAARSLSVLFGVATVPVVYCLGRRVYGPGAGLLAAVLLSLSQFHWFLSQMVRMYSLVVLLAALSMLGAVRVWQRGASPHHRAYASATSLLVYSHLYGWLLVLSQNVTAVLHARPLSALGRWVRTQAVVVATFLPWVAVVVAVLTMLGWRREGRDLWYLPVASAFRPLEILSQINGELSFLYSRRLGLALWGVAFLLATGDLVRRLWRHGRVDPGRLGLFLAIVLPLAIATALSFYNPVFGASRYLSIVLPAYYVFVAGGAVSVLASRRGAALLAAALTLWSLAATAEGGRRYVMDPFRDVAGYIRAEDPSTAPVVLIGPSGILPLRYYGSGDGRVIRHVVPSADVPPPPHADCIWVVHRRATAPVSPLLARLRETHTTIATQHFPLRGGGADEGLEVALLRHRDTPPPAGTREALPGVGRCR